MTFEVLPPWSTFSQTPLIPSDGNAIVPTAKMFLDLPYLWGASAFGYDCSGIAYSMYRHHGMILPRDRQIKQK